ncbi:MAG: collagen-binding domain-containing protein, partial [Cellulosimicrobium funkei]
IVSVPAGTTDLQGSVFGEAGKAASFVMWDLSRLDGPITLGAGGARLDGSVYAPTADLTVEASPLDGQVVARDLTLLGGEAHAYLFAGSIPCGTVPAESGSLTVTKRVVGDAASVVPAGTAFTVAYSVDGSAGELTLPVDGTATLDDLPLGAEVVLGEPDFPTVEGVEWGAPTWQVDGGTVEPGDDGTVRVEVAAASDVAVTLTNTADRPLEPTPAPTPTTPTTPTDPTDPTVPTTPDVPGAPDAPGAPVDGGTGGLATTGVQAAGVAIAALLLVALGTGVLVLRRRRGA